MHVSKITLLTIIVILTNSITLLFTSIENYYYCIESYEMAYIMQLCAIIFYVLSQISTYTLFFYRLYWMCVATMYQLKKISIGVFLLVIITFIGASIAIIAVQIMNIFNSSLFDYFIDIIDKIEWIQIISDLLLGIYMLLLFVKKVYSVMINIMRENDYHISLLNDNQNSLLDTIIKVSILSIIDTISTQFLLIMQTFAYNNICYIISNVWEPIDGVISSIVVLLMLDIYNKHYIILCTKLHRGFELCCRTFITNRITSHKNNRFTLF